MARDKSEISNLDLNFSFLRRPALLKFKKTTIESDHKKAIARKEYYHLIRDFWSYTMPMSDPPPEAQLGMPSALNLRI
jgi:hypothetical protein